MTGFFTKLMNKLDKKLEKKAKKCCCQKSEKCSKSQK